MGSVGAASILRRVIATSRPKDPIQLFKQSNEDKATEEAEELIQHRWRRRSGNEIRLQQHIAFAKVFFAIETTEKIALLRT